METETSKRCPKCGYEDLEEAFLKGRNRLRRTDPPTWTCPKCSYQWSPHPGI
jgi:ssDNA-binding Zn-finger/Zn-ribbon topoisomerase 1